MAPNIAIMGIVNVTPDSFSDGGRFATLDTAVAQAERLIVDGADILDIGGESTRPFSDPVSLEEELRRVIPVIESIRKQHPSIRISIDTTKAEVARRALQAGASIINDVAALRQDPAMIDVVKETDVPVIIMHMLGTPKDMQLNPQYDNVVEEIIAFFAERLHFLDTHGIARERIIIDPGIGFGKTVDHNLSILKHLDRFAALGQPVLLGHSRKRFLGEVTGVGEEEARDLATAVVAALCATRAIDMIRVHNVAATRQALAVASALQHAL